MTRIDFHSNVPDKMSYACRLARKAYLAGNRVVLLLDDQAQLTALNALMWSFSEIDFLPHVPLDDVLAAETPILLTDSDTAELPDPGHFDILINLSRRQPANFTRYSRLFEIISQDEEDAASGRRRYVAYKQQNYQPTHFVAGKP